ncbi:MAG: xylulokinase [Eubacteriales bacterium]
MSQYILAHDLGTSGNKAVLYRSDGTLAGSVLCEYPTEYPHEGWAQQDSADWWRAVCSSTSTLLDMTGIPARDIAAVSFSGQMMNCLPLDRDGEPLRKSIIWADVRASEQADRMKSIIGMRELYGIAGSRLSSSYAAAKILWLRDNEPDIYKRTHKIVQAKDYIIYRLTGQYVTDYSDATGYQLLDITTKQWSQELLRALDISPSLLPDVYPSAHIAGTITPQAASLTGLVAGTPVVIGCGDGAAACVGAGAVSEGSPYCSLGSSAWISMPTHTPLSEDGMQAYNIVHPDPQLYAPACSMQAAGYSYSWLKNTFCPDLVEKAREEGVSPYVLMDRLASSSPAGANGLLFLPYLMGERCPHWNPDAQGTFIGLNMTSTRADIIRSVLEGVGYNLRALADIFEPSGHVDNIIMVSGGSKSRFWLQIISDICGRTLLVPEHTEEATSIGAVICGGVGAGIFKDYQVCGRFNKIIGRISPNTNIKAAYDAQYSLFLKSYNSLREVYGELAKARKG